MEKCVCPVCGLKIEGDEPAIQYHVNKCLDGISDSVVAPFQETHETDDGQLNTLLEQSAKTETLLESEYNDPEWDQLLKEHDFNTALDASHQQTICKTEDVEERLPMETTGTASVDEKKWKRPPDFKWVKYTSFTVDAFRYGPINGCTAYFLSHFHSDHYMGLTSKFQHGPIYCSQITADLVMQQLRVPKEWIYPLPLEENITIQGVQVRLIDANHCPGAVLFYFEAPDPPTRILHTGDFRACEAHWTHPNLQGRIDFLYLDTTYCKPIYKFPPQEQVLQLLSDLLLRAQSGEPVQSIVNPSSLWRYFGKPKTSMMDKFLKTKPKSNILVVVGSYSIGKEKVFLRASQVLNSKIYCKANKLRLLKCLQLPDLDHRLTKNPKEANVHVVSMNTLAKDDLIEYFETFKNDFDSMIAVKPTGWTFKPNQVPDLKHLSPSFVSQRIVLVPLAYSEHSSFAELETFAKEMHFTKIFSTVPSRYSLDPILDKWVK